MIDHLRGVDVLALESNYCPVLQVASDRPRFLKDRIMCGSGHLSNEQCARAVGLIAPRSHVVLLHLSQECNTPELALAGHRDRGYGVTVSSQHEATAWIDFESGGGAREVTLGRQRMLFSSGAG
jgi:phosphoribosyl 1,2-cyclic phosphodiesterase